MVTMVNKPSSNFRLDPLESVLVQRIPNHGQLVAAECQLGPEDDAVYRILHVRNSSVCEEGLRLLLPREAAFVQNLWKGHGRGCSQWFSHQTFLWNKRFSESMECSQLLS